MIYFYLFIKLPTFQLWNFSLFQHCKSDETKINKYRSAAHHNCNSGKVMKSRFRQFNRDWQLSELSVRPMQSTIKCRFWTPLKAPGMPIIEVCIPLVILSQQAPACGLPTVSALATASLSDYLFWIYFFAIRIQIRFYIQKQFHGIKQKNKNWKSQGRGHACQVPLQRRPLPVYDLIK